jgi:fatty acid desaturase
MAVSVSVMTHNHNHLPMWKNKTLNVLTDYWLTLFYGFPVFVWIPTHNMNHHKLTNKEGDYTITYRNSEKNNLLTLISYPSISGYFQQIVIIAYLRDMRKKDPNQFYLCISQVVVLVAFVAIALLIDWKKTLWFIIIPQQFSVYSVLIFNYVQHVHADELSEYNHSRNFVGLLNFMLFNNGLHTAHHEKAGVHWSLTPIEHKKIEDKINPILIERSFWGYIFRNYFVGLIFPKYRTQSMRLERMQKQAA